MNDMSNITLPAIGSPFAGGFFAGLFHVNGQAHALIVAPKDGGECDMAWNSAYKTIVGAQSYDDGLANTNAMADAGSELAKWARGLRIGNHDDWYVPSQDELEICYRNLKPTTDKNYLYGRSGINLSAIEPTRPYIVDVPAQTAITEFQEGGAQAFDDMWYWTSTQHAADAGYAWCQDFGSGNQSNDIKLYELRARAVRRLAI